MFRPQKSGQNAKQLFLDYINNNAKGQLFIEKSKILIAVIFATKKVLEPMFFAKILTRFIKIKKLARFMLF